MIVKSIRILFPGAEILWKGTGSAKFAKNFCSNKLVEIMVFYIVYSHNGNL